MLEGLDAQNGEEWRRLAVHFAAALRTVARDPRLPQRLRQHIADTFAEAGWP